MSPKQTDVKVEVSNPTLTNAEDGGSVFLVDNNTYSS